MIENICNTSFIIVAHLSSGALIKLHSYLSTYVCEAITLVVGIEVRSLDYRESFLCTVVNIEIQFKHYCILLAYVIRMSICVYAYL